MCNLVRTRWVFPRIVPSHVYAGTHPLPVAASRAQCIHRAAPKRVCDGALHIPIDYEADV